MRNIDIKSINDRLDKIKRILSMIEQSPLKPLFETRIGMWVLNGWVGYSISRAVNKAIAR